MKRIMCLLAVMLGMGLPLEAATVSLKSGWNLISPLQNGEEVQIEAWLSRVGLNTSDVAKIWEYSRSGGWSYWSPSGGTLPSLKARQGYWFLLPAAKDISIEDTGSSDLVFSLSSPGWHLVGSNVNASVAIEGSNGMLSSENFSSENGGESLVKIWRYSSSGWADWSRSRAGFSELVPNQGYWFLLSDGLDLNDGNADLSDLLPPVCPGCPPIQ